MTPHSVYWHDGMFMWPHHMQQEERSRREQSRRQHKWDVQHNWGLRLIEIDAEALKGQRLIVRRLQARLRDGTLVEVPGEGKLPFLDLKELAAGPDSVTILLAIPKLEPTRGNAAVRSGPAADASDKGRAEAEQKGTGSLTRYLVEELEIADENTGQDVQVIQVRGLRLLLLPDTADTAGYDVLPLARLERLPAADNAFGLDEKYIPPVLACDAWKPLAIDILQYTFHHLGSLMENLANQATSRGVSLEAHSAEDQVLLGRLAVLNEGSTVLNTLAFAAGIHPFAAYLELCRLAGQLALYSETHRVPSLPHYDHDDLGTCFFKVKQHLDALLEPARANCEQRPFIGAGLRMQVALEPKWLTAWQMFVGVHSPIPQEQLIRLLTKPDKLDMKIGSGGNVDKIYERGMKGLAFTPVQQAPRALPAGWTYFQVNPDSDKNEWAQVQQSLTLAVRVNQNRLAVSPRGDIEGQRELTVKLGAPAGTTTMQFTLFLVSAESEASSP